MKTLTTLSLLLITSFAYAIEKPVVAVFPFNAVGVSKTTANLTSDFLRRELIKLGRMTIVERDQMESVLKAQGENLDECTEEGCAIRMGEMLDMEMIVVGEVVKSFSRFVVSARLIDLSNRKIISGGALTRDNIREEQITDDIDQLAWELVSGLKLKTNIANIDGQDIYLDAGVGLVEVGQQLTIKRKGDEIRDPSTDEFLGHKESEIGTIEVVQTMTENLALCKSVTGSGFQLGDFSEIGGELQPVIPDMEQNSQPLQGLAPQRSRTQKSYGSIAINSDPQGSTVILDGDVLGETPLTKSGIEAGDHNLMIHKDGYNDFIQMVTIPVGRSLPVTAKLVMMSGNLLIKSDPIGAWITFDGTARGEATRDGISIKMLQVGRYKVKGELEHYYPAEQTVDVDFNLTKPITLTLKPMPGAIYASSTPSGADILVDGKASGMKTPGKVDDVEPKEHTIIFRLSGYQDKSVKVTVEPDKTVMLTETLEKAIAEKQRISSGRGAIKVTTYPSSARISVDGKFTGLSPIIINDLSVRLHNVSAFWTKADKSIIERVSVSSGDTAKVILVREWGTISVNTKPSGVRISVDGEYKGISPIKINNLPKGEYAVTAEWSNDLYTSELANVLYGEISEVNMKKPKPEKANTLYIQNVLGTIVLILMYLYVLS